MTASAVDRWGSSTHRLRRVAVGGALKPYVSSLTILERQDDEVDRVYVLPDSRATLLFNINSGVRINSMGGFADAEGTLTLLGAPTRGGSATISDVPLTIVVTLTPIGAHLLSGVPMDALTNSSIELEEVGGKGARQLKQMLTCALSNDERLACLEGYLRGRFDCCGGSALRATRQVATAIGVCGQHLEWDSATPRSWLPLARASDRHLRRLFRNVVGLTPHTMIRIERFNHAVRLARLSVAPEWAQIALCAGYYDQAHMIAEFNAFVGLPPTGFLDALRHGLPHLQGCWFTDIAAPAAHSAALHTTARR